MLLHFRDWLIREKNPFKLYLAFDTHFYNQLEYQFINLYESQTLVNKKKISII